MALLLVMAGATAGAAALLTPATAEASVGSQPGTLTLRPSGGAVTRTPTWSTSTACPVGFQTSAVLYVLNTNGSIGSVASPTVASPTAPFSGTMLATVGQSLALGTNVKPGQHDEWVVGCFTGIGGTGRKTWVQSIVVTLSANGRSYTSSRGTGGVGGGTGQSQSVPWVLIGLMIVVAAGGVGSWQAWQRRRRRLDDQVIAAAKVGSSSG